MPVRMMTDEEKEQIFGNGFVVMGQRRPVPGKERDVSSGAPTKASVSVRYATKDDYKKLNFYNVGPVYRAERSGASGAPDTPMNVFGEESSPPKNRV